MVLGRYSLRFTVFFAEIGEVGFSLNRRVSEGKSANLGIPLPARRGRAGSLELDEEKRSAQHVLVRPGPPKWPPLPLPYSRYAGTDRRVQEPFRNLQNQKNVDRQNRTDRDRRVTDR